MENKNLRMVDWDLLSATIGIAVIAGGFIAIILMIALPLII